MSTTVTMLETYDAQMLDYQNDTDVAMHPSSDPWLNEATMDDDTFTNDATIEVDMDGLQEDQTTEYEMTDEAESYAPEMVDIEVEDASPPQPAPLYDSSIIPNAATSTTQQPADISIPPNSTPPHSAATLPPDSLYPVDSQLNEPYAPTDILVEEPVPSIHLRSTPPQTTQSPLDTHAGHLLTPDLSRPAAEPITISLSSSFQTGEYAGSVEGGAYAEVPVSADVPELQHEEGDHEPHTMPEEEHAPTDEPSGHPIVQPAHVEEEYAAEATYQQLQQTVNAEAAEQQQQQPETAADETHAPVESNDPHEISEGVYIDPPPPVLISLESSEYPNICLFNRPSSRSGTPSSPTAESPPGSDCLVLLHHQPVLYYEPLSSVFEALRHEEYLMNSPDLRDGELILDAYDLQLAVSEDNVYAREVTLHDLNVIHDGSDIAGPLRLRLRSSVPRFAFRYHQLRDQIARLHLATEAAEVAENAEHQPVEDSSHEQAAPETEQPEANAVPEPSLPQDTSTDAPENDRLDENKDEAAQEPFLTSGAQWDDHNGEAQTDPNDTQEGEHEGLNTFDSLPEEDAHAADGAGEPFAPLDVPDVYEEAETGEESTVAQESNDYAEDDATHEDVEQDYPDLPDDDDDGDDGFEAAPHEAVDEPVLPTVLDTSDETQEPPPEDGVGQDTYEAPTEESVQQEDAASVYVDVEESIVPTELTDAAEAVEQAGLSAGIGSNIPDSGDVDAALDTPLEASGLKNVEPHLQEINEFEEWDDELDGDGELDSTWDEQDSPSAQSSVTVSSTKTSMKRSLDETDFEELVQEEEEVSPGSPHSKRVRTQ
ncbi:hypothetical protein PC9H_001278 [Pleurotus ostreatus]|uniref:Uncharacterized protein n=1 Tax=Pleurotus ostreatus TaxID=5322 RepID=A0A8H7DW21_PLEOS|nr:uncharacterized protein PC9H_001278 [Pleurotus ostreatus]KAF7440929.1 hypothetical protein PC9H_001278 [Pleurotus ostreatus]KAJ8699627.1 hypothetical protein PTI98_002722 [Pleurotus ostreatus]